MTDSTETTAVGRSHDVKYALALHRTPKIGARRFQKLIAAFGSAAGVFAASARQLRAAVELPDESLSYLQNPDWDAVDGDMAWFAQPGNHIILYSDASYPSLLKEIPDPPGLLFVHGDPDYLLQPQLAIVGSRNPSRDGLALASEFAAYLAGYGLTITSGLASGIDGAAHRGALAAQGSTVAVMGTGLDRVYPASHRKLAHEIAVNGALVSEFSPGTAPVASNFPRRNRIISGLSLGTLVVEAAVRSGSLITARAARDQGREVFAIPGSLHNPLARGCHALIREGAKLVETGEHILEELVAIIPQLVSPSISSAASATPVLRQEETSGLASDYVQLLDFMGYEPVTVNQLVGRSGLTPQELSSMLLVLELDDYLVSGAGGTYTRVR